MKLLKLSSLFISFFIMFSICAFANNIPEVAFLEKKDVHQEKMSGIDNSDELFDENQDNDLQASAESDFEISTIKNYEQKPLPNTVASNAMSNNKKYISACVLCISRGKYVKGWGRCPSSWMGHAYAKKSFPRWKLCRRAKQRVLRNAPKGCRVYCPKCNFCPGKGGACW
jgi:hypothetical protein